MRHIHLPLVALILSSATLASFAQTDLETVEQTLSQLQEETTMRIQARVQREAQLRLAAVIKAKQDAIKDKRIEPVIIIGAGLAGLAAGNYLDTHSHRNFLILEAGKSVGGRAKTLRLHSAGWHGEPLNIGASTIHGYSTHNPLTHLSALADVQGYTLDEDSQTLYDYNGKRVGLSHSQRDEHRYNHFLSSLSTMTNSRYQQLSIGDALFNYLGKHQLSKDETRGLMYRASSQIEQSYGQDLRLLSLPNLNSAEDFDGPDWRASNGFDKLPNFLASPLSNRIKTSTQIKSIDYSLPNEIVLTSSTGKAFYAKKVIITVPVSVLKKHIRFIPTLPKAKTDALAHIKMGTQNKLWLKFPKVFWDKNADSIHYQASAANDVKGFINKGKNPSFINAYKQTGEPILIAVTSGDYANYLEQLDDKTVTKKLMQTLRTIYGKKIPQPIAHYYTRWNKAPLSLGSFSSLTIGAKPHNQDYQQLATPIDDRLYFAGEATSIRFPGTAHGAYLSGIREARRILEGKPGLTEQKISSYISNLKLFPPGKAKKAQES